MKSSTFLLVFLCLLCSLTLFAQHSNIQQATSINSDGSAPDSSAMLDVQSTNKGMLVPRMTTAARIAIPQPANGLLVFDNSTGSYWYFHNQAWHELTTSMSAAGSGIVDTTLAIPDCDTINGISSSIELFQTGNIDSSTQIEICIDITHYRISDLNILLESPDGETITLYDNNAFGNDIDFACFTSGAEDSISGYHYPLTGKWLPEESFINLYNRPIAGYWTLIIFDNNCGTEGQLKTWSISFSRSGHNPTSLTDRDGDTRVSVEAFPDEDIVRISAGGKERLKIFNDSTCLNGLVSVKGKFESGDEVSASGNYSFIGGGESNEASGSRSFVGGGSGNEASGIVSFSGGGTSNTASNTFSFVGGGSSNTSSGTSAFIGGGEQNTSSNFYSFVGGGAQNVASGVGSFIGAGITNVASGESTFIGGGRSLFARSHGEAVFGIHNTDYTPNSINSFHPSDRVFVIGNGVNPGNRSNAVTVLKNGNVGIGTDVPKRLLEIKAQTAGDNLPVVRILKENCGHACAQGEPTQALSLQNTNPTPNTIGIGFADVDQDTFPTAWIGAKLQDKTNHRGQLQFQTRNSSGLDVRMVIDSSGKVGIGTDSPVASALLDLQSDSKGLLTPRLTTLQREAISSPADGLLVFDTDECTFWYFENQTWREIPTSMAQVENGSNNTQLAIPDNDPGGITSIISLDQPGAVKAGTQFIVCLDITHSYTGDLDISLMSPEGTSLDLSSDNGSGGDDYSATCFTTESTNSIVSGSAPFSGRWQPEQAFSVFTGDTIAGDWKLKIVDDALVDTGQLITWSIQINSASSAVPELADKDRDTRIRVENLPDEDMIRFDVKGEEAMIIDGSGKVGINTSNPLLQFHINRGGSNMTIGTGVGTGMVITGDFFRPRIYLEHTDAPTGHRVIMNEFKDGRLAWNEMNDDASAFTNSNIFVIETDGNIGLGIADPSHPLHLGSASGAHCTAAGTWTNGSDRRLKKDIQAMDYGLKELMSLNPVRYRMKSNDDKQIGFIAQDVREILPELVSGIEGDMEKGETLGLSYGNLTAVLVKAVQEQQEIIEMQEQKLASQKAEMDRKLMVQQDELASIHDELAAIKKLLEVKATAVN